MSHYAPFFFFWLQPHPLQDLPPSHSRLQTHTVNGGVGRLKSKSRSRKEQRRRESCSSRNAGQRQWALEPGSEGKSETNRTANRHRRSIFKINVINIYFAIHMAILAKNGRSHAAHAASRYIAPVLVFVNRRNWATPAARSWALISISSARCTGLAFLRPGGLG